MQHALGNFPQHFLAGSATEFLDLFVHAIETAAFTEFHGDGYRTGGLVHEGSVVLADIFGCAVFVEFEFS